MVSSPSALGASLDKLAAENPTVSVWEAPEAVTVSGLDEQAVRSIIPSLLGMGWQAKIEDSAGDITPLDEVDDALGPFLITLDKPMMAGTSRFLTIIGFRSSLDGGNMSGVIQIACCTTGFSTGLFSVTPWGAGDIFIEASETKSPRNIVRDTSGNSLLPLDVRAILLRAGATNSLWADPAFQAFASHSAPRLAWSIASEVSSGGVAHFQGPPRSAMSVAKLQTDLCFAAFSNLQRLVAWVYEDPRSAEQRHALVSIEIARSSRSDLDLLDIFRLTGRDILESARLGYQLSLSDLSREAIKAQTDLRKAVADDMNKAADAVRSMTGSIAIAVASGVGLVGARATTVTPEWIITLVGSAVGLHLLAVAISGWMALATQRSLRRQWRHRFYRFISDDDYTAMIDTPMNSVEHQYNLIGAFAVVVGSVILLSALQGFTFLIPAVTG